MVLDDYQNWGDRSVKFSQIPVSTVAGVPMLFSGELVGVLTNQLKGAITYNPNKQTYLITFKNPDIRSYNPVH